MVYDQRYEQGDQTIRHEGYMVYDHRTQYEERIIHVHRLILSFYHGMCELDDQMTHREEYMVYVQMIMSGQKI
jgi:hypothetical protein